MRFLNVDEEVQLLAALAERSMDVHDMALLSLDCGLRAGEIFKLAWSDVDLAGGLLALRGTKSGHNRHAFITARVHSMLESRGPKKPSALVFPPRRGARITQISKLFGRVVADLGLNFGITDPLQKEVFHSLRHTFASKLVGQGVDLYRVQVSWATRPPQWSNGMPT
ncbi:MAG: tyrosine-type recombinase/integrase [Desulfovibrionaceae bacterium]